MNMKYVQLIPLDTLLQRTPITTNQSTTLRLL